MIVDQQRVETLADALLTFIEVREAEQIAYGIYDVTLSGAEVLAEFVPAVALGLAPEEMRKSVTEALRFLYQATHIIRFEQEDEPAKWVFRSRITETMRLLKQLRQRLIFDEKHRKDHWISSSKRLVEDLKFHIAARRVPRRDIPARDCLARLLVNGGEQAQAATLLLEVIEQVLPKLQKMSGFQQRALEAILKVIEFDELRATERGVVVTASK